ncbi:MAG: helix-turn-helix domain-containing protein, partial [Dysgonomonas sp.]|uniref:helix-turn-helix domain-containing protein n=1 Tax=Dysgonomonas sp. TaxID=1891233 RepID=UPI003A83F16B
MLKLRQVIRLYNQGKGTKAIAGMLYISRNTIKKYLHIFLSSGLSYDAFSAMSDLELSQKFLVANHPEKSQRQIDLEALLPGICSELKRKGVTKEMLYRQYIEKYPEGYVISRFCGFIRLYLAQHRPVMHIEHKAGDKMYIDFTGQKLHLDNGDGTKT